MENFALITLARAVEQAAQGMVVRRIVQHHSRGFLLQARSSRIPALKILLHPGSPLLYISGARPPVDGVTTEFLMILRKHLAGARLIETEKPLSERILALTFKTALPARELDTVKLVVELFPNAPNMFLLDANGSMLASMSPSNRELGAYDTYRYPVTGKMDLAAAVEGDFGWFDEAAYLKSPDYLIRTVAGVGPLLANEIAHQSHRGRHPVETLADIVGRSSRPGPTAWVYSRMPLSLILRTNDLSMLRDVVISPIELESLRSTHSSQTYPGILEAVRIVSDELESRTLLALAKAPLMRQLRDQRRRIETRRRRLIERRSRFLAASELRTAGQLLAASGADMDRHHETVQVTDYFADTPGSREIRLDASKTLRQNVARMFKECRKAERGLGIVEQQLNDLDKVERRLADQETRIGSIGNWEAWLARSGSAARPSSPAAKDGRPHRTGRRRSIWLDGHEVLVGRNGRENDELTFRVAAGDDFWFHAAHYSGSHVIVRNPDRADRLDDLILVRAAQLAAYHSQARNSSKVDVHYTRRKFVTKPRRAKPGMVRLREFETVTVEPHDWTGLNERSGLLEALDRTRS